MMNAAPGPGSAEVLSEAALPLQLLLTTPPLPQAAGPGLDPALLRALAQLLQVSLHSVAPLDDPDQALAALQQQGGSWLAGPVPDPGRTWAAGRSWAQALGAWRQPTLLLVPAPQLDSGLPAAATALLLRHQVPLVGLVQLGGSWQPQNRRLEALPWLGALGAAGEDPPDDQALVQVLRQTWRQRIGESGWAEAQRLAWD